MYQCYAPQFEKCPDGTQKNLTPGRGQGEALHSGRPAGQGGAIGEHQMRFKSSRRAEHFPNNGRFSFLQSIDKNRSRRIFEGFEFDRSVHICLFVFASEETSRMVIFGPQEGNINCSLLRRIGFYSFRLWYIRVKKAISKS